MIYLQVLISFSIAHLHMRNKGWILTIFITLFLFIGESAYAQYESDRYHWEKINPEVPSLFSNDTLELCILGDIMMHSKQIEYTQNPDDSYTFESFFRLIEKPILEADISLANMEFPLAGKPYTGYPSFSAPDQFGDYLAEIGFDVFLMANNHLFDKGSYGAKRTLDRYRQLQQSHGIHYCGMAGSQEEADETFPLFIRRKGMLIAIINFTYGSNQMGTSQWPRLFLESDKEAIEKAFQKAKERKADFIIACPHWGIEYQLKHSERQENTARWLIELGADAVIGAHPHVIQDYQTIDGIPVAYSLGNAVSNMSAANTQLELMATIRFARDTNGDLKMLPLEFTYLWCSLPGGFGDNYTVIPVEEFLDRSSEWNNVNDFKKMSTTYSRVLRTSGIKDRNKE